MPDKSATYPQLRKLFSATSKGVDRIEYPQPIRDRTSRNPQSKQPEFTVEGKNTGLRFHSGQRDGFNEWRKIAK